MADQRKEPSDLDSKNPLKSFAPDEEEISDADLDAAISESDPEFLNTLGELAKDKSLSLSQIIISDEDQALNEEKDAWAKSGRVRRTVFRLFPAIAWVSIKCKKIQFVIFSFLRAEWVRAKNFLYFLATDGKNKVLKRIKTFFDFIFDHINEAQRNFRYLSVKLKTAFFAIALLILGTGFFIYRSLTHGVVPTGNNLFITSLEKVSTEVFDYNPETEVEPFYENLRVSTNFLLIPKMVVNLKKSEHSGSNPMAALEFFVEGMTPEAIIEIKDREVEVRDRMQRVVEEFTFDQVDSQEGKTQVSEKMKKEVNLLLTKGKVKKFWIKTALVKP
jgi:flagellar basal body-associated protein FliL